MIVSDEDLLLQGAHVGGQDVQPVLLVAHLIHVDVHSRHVLVASCQSWVLTHTYTHIHIPHTHTHHTHTTHTTHIPHTHTTHTHHTHTTHKHTPHTQVTAGVSHQCSFTNTGYSISHHTFIHMLQLVFLITCLLTNTCYSWYFSSHIHLPTHLPTDIGYSQYFS